MREIKSEKITETIRDLFIKANSQLPDEVFSALSESRENDPAASGILGLLCENAKEASKGHFPICQDTGMAFVFAEIGQDVHVSGALFKDAVNEGVCQAYAEGYLRKSVVRSPLDRVNTSDNTPAVIYTEIVPGDKIKLYALPKGFGSENMSRLKMMVPSASVDDICDFVVDAVVGAGANPCPPVTVGVGIGGSFDYCAYLSKKALLGKIGVHDPDNEELEEKILKKINEKGKGAQGLGGCTTALWVFVRSYPTHIAGLPVAVNICCHASRHAEAFI